MQKTQQQLLLFSGKINANAEHANNSLQPREGGWEPGERGVGKRPALGLASLKNAMTFFSDL